MKRKRQMPPHIVLPNGQWRFIKRGRKSKTIGAAAPKRRRVKTIARYRGRRGGGARGKLGSFAPVIAGLADSIVDKYSPIDGLGSIAVGYGLKNEFSKNIGMYKVGQSIATYIPVIGTGASGGGQSQV